MRLVDDKATIVSAWTADGQTGASVGMRGVTAIKPYDENGDMAPVTWLEVWKGEQLFARLNTLYMAEIQYARRRTG